jgi:hypothetical protein
MARYAVAGTRAKYGGGPGVWAFGGRSLEWAESQGSTTRLLGGYPPPSLRQRGRDEDGEDRGSKSRVSWVCDGGGGLENLLLGDIFLSLGVSRIEG